MNEYKSVKGYQTEQLAKFSQHHIFVYINSRMTLLHYFHFFYNLQKLISLLSFFIFPLFKILIANLDRKHFEF